MKIVHVVDYLMPEIGYQEYLLPKANSEDGVSATIITGDRYSPLPNYKETWGKVLGERICGRSDKLDGKLRIIRNKVLFEFFGRPWIRNLKSTLKEIDPDVIFIHGTGSFNIYRIGFSSRFKKTLIYADNHMIVDIVQKGFIQSIYYFFHKVFMKKFLQNRVNRFFGLSEDTIRYLKDFEGIRPQKISSMQLGIDSYVFNNQLRKSAPLNKQIKIIQTGKLDDEKRPDILAHAAVECLKQGLNIKVSFIGNGPLEMINKIKMIFEESGYQDAVSFTEFMPSIELKRVFSESSIAIFPGGTTLSVIEAAACGCPVIMNDLPTSLERNRLGIGLIHKHLDYKDLAIKITLLANDEVLQSNISEAGLKAVKEHFTYQSISKDLIALAAKDLLSLPI